MNTIGNDHKSRQLLQIQFVYKRKIKRKLAKHAHIYTSKISKNISCQIQVSKAILIYIFIYYFDIFI